MTTWWSDTESPKAWMSVRDADLYEVLLHRLAVRRGDRTLRVIEWGTGRSTLWYTRFLDTLGKPYRWLALEHDRRYFDAELAPALAERPNALVRQAEELAGTDLTPVLDGTGILAVSCAGAGEDYLSIPEWLGFSCDLAVIDGRLRRRCVLEAARLAGSDGHVALHDAWRPYYQSAWSEFRSGRRFGDEWWIGSHRRTDFADLLPWHAFTDQLQDVPVRTGGVRVAWRRAATMTVDRAGARLTQMARRG